MENKSKISVKRLLDGRVTDGPHETPEFKVTGIPFLSVDGIQDGKLIFQGCRYISQEDAENYRKKCAPRFGDILLGKAASVGKVAFVDVDFIFSVWSPLALLRPKSTTLDGKYLYYCIQSELIQYQIKLFSNFNTQQNIGMRDIENLYIPDLPIVQQKSIARFLDRKTAAIDTLIAKKQRLIQLLEEKRTALINQAVTKGLNPNAPMKDSGSDWIGETPTHWEVRQLKYLCVLQRGFDLPSQERKEGHYPIYGGGGITGYHNTAMVQAPGIVTGRYGTVGEVYLVEEPFWPLNTSLYVKEFWGNSPTFIKYLLSVIPIKSYSAKSAVPGVDRNDLHIIPVARPPREEQDLIVQYLEQASDYKQRMTETIERQIEKLQEYRRSLITAAVTGKLEISEVEADV